MTIVSGSKRCTVTLDGSGVTFTMDHSGVWRLCHKRRQNTVTYVGEYRMYVVLILNCCYGDSCCDFQALVNIPGVSELTSRRDIEASSVTLSSTIQVIIKLGGKAILMHDFLWGCSSSSKHMVVAQSWRLWPCIWTDGVYNFEVEWWCRHKWWETSGVVQALPTTFGVRQELRA